MPSPNLAESRILIFLEGRGLVLVTTCDDESNSVQDPKFSYFGVVLGLGVGVLLPTVDSGFFQIYRRSPKRAYFGEITPGTTIYFLGTGCLF